VAKPTLDEVFLTLTGHGVETDDEAEDSGAAPEASELEGSRA